MLTLASKQAFSGMKTVLLNRLQSALSPSHLTLLNESSLHMRGKETHFNIKIVSPKFRGLTKIQKHQLVYQCLSEEMPKIHALTLTCRTPEEEAQLDDNQSPNCLHQN